MDSSTTSLPATITPSDDLLPTHIDSPLLPSTADTPPRQPLTRKLASAFTSSKHKAREAQRQQRDEEDKHAHERRKTIRLAMVRAKELGTPQRVGWDGDGDQEVVEVFVLPPEGEEKDEAARAGCGIGNGHKRFVKYETYMKLVGGGNKGEFDRTMGMAGMGMALGF